MNSGKAFLSIIASAATAAVAGILFAPYKGSKTRRILSKKGRKYTRKMTKKVRDSANSMRSKLKSTQKEITSEVKKGRKAAEETVQKVVDVLPENDKKS